MSRPRIAGTGNLFRVCVAVPGPVSLLALQRPVPVVASEFECDAVVFAIGTHANPILGQTSNLQLNKRGYIALNSAR